MLHYAPQHVSSSTLLIIRRTNCITTASGIVTLCKQPYSMRVESGVMQDPTGLPEYASSLLRIQWRTAFIATCFFKITLLNSMFHYKKAILHAGDFFISPASYIELCVL